MTEWFERLTDRAVLQVSGADAENFLENLVTCPVALLKEGEARFGALLTPQGKILFDFFLFRHDGGFFLDCASEQVDALQKRLLFYRLRAKVDIEQLSEMQVAAFDGPEPAGIDFLIKDPRHKSMGSRAYGNFELPGGSGEYNRFRVQLGVPEGGKDYPYGDAFPHEALMDQHGGVDFKKGCYVGQEVVSRMQHRGTARKRVVQVSGASDLPATGTEVLADGKSAGTLGTVMGKQGLAMLRLDRVHEADQVTAEGVELLVELPHWVSFGWPEAK